MERDTTKPSAPSADTSAALFSRCSHRSVPTGSIPEKKSARALQIFSLKFQRDVHTHFYEASYNKPSIHSNADKNQKSLNQLVKGAYYLLYHSAERLRLKDGQDLSTDPYAQMRFLTRNFVGFPDGRIQLVHDIKKKLNINSVYYLRGMENIGVILYISANYRGCFSVLYIL